MKIHTASAALIVAGALAGCATPYGEAPLATNFPSVKQQKAQAAAHWNMIAEDMAAQLSTRLLPTRPLHVVMPNAKTAFDRAFANQLLSALMAKGHTASKSPNNALTVEIDTQAVTFSPDRPQYRYTGTATALTTGLWALHVGEASPGFALFATIGAADALSWFRSEFATGATPQTEIIVTASVTNGNEYVARSTSVYYVADSDKGLYESVGRTFKVTGGE